MLKGRGRDTRTVTSPAPAHLARPLPQQPATRTLPAVPSSSKLTLRTPTAPRAPLAKPEPDYEVVEFPSEQYVNAKLQPPPPPPPRPPTGHPAEAGASCGLCGGGGARVRCAECGRRALCASCDDMYHRHPKRRHHQRQALTMSQMRDERPPLPPKAAAPVPPPRRHKLSGASPSPRPPADPRSATLGPHSLFNMQNASVTANNHMSTLSSHAPIPPHLQGKILGSMPYLPNLHHGTPMQQQTNAMGPLASGWGRPRGSLPGFNIPPNMQMPTEATWQTPENIVTQSWGRPLRRGASVLELGDGAMMAGAGMGGCAGCATAWRYGSCASLDHPWAAWPPPAPACCAHAPPPHHAHSPYTPQPYRRADSRAVSRAASRACSRAASPAMSTRSRTSRRTKHRTPSPPPVPSSDADSESESDGDHRPNNQDRYPQKPRVVEPSAEENSLGPAPAPANASWQCEHCTFVNEPGIRVCVVCCRTPTAAPKVVDIPPSKTGKATDESRKHNSQSINDSAKAIADTARSIARLDVNDRSTSSPSPAPSNREAGVQNGITTRTKNASKKERISMGCGPSPPREENSKKTINRLVTPTREPSIEPSRHDMAVGSTPPKEVQSPRSSSSKQNVSQYRQSVKSETPPRHSVSVGPSPPREEVQRSPSISKKSTGSSPPGEGRTERRSSASARANVSNTGTSPPPQSISTQTYEVPNSWERAPSRSRRRFRDDARRERSHSRHSLSSDTRESERSARTSGGGGASGRWEWREGRDSSPGGEWSGSERRRARPTRLARRASHLDLRRTRAPTDRRASYYGSEAVSPEPTRAMSLEALAGAGASAAAVRGLELARLMGEAERLGFSAAEVQAALAQSPAAPLAWLRERWPSLCAGVRAAAARLEPRARVSDLEARAALARHRGAMWPAVTDCVERHRRQAVAPAVAAVTGRVWGSPTGAEDDAVPPRRAEGSSDEFEGLAPIELRDDDWMYLPLDANPKALVSDREPWELPPDNRVYSSARDAALAVDLLVQAAVPVRDNSLLGTLLRPDIPIADDENFGGLKPHGLDMVQSENDFIEAYNALTRSSPLPVHEQVHTTESGPKRDTYDVLVDDSQSHINNVANANVKTDVAEEQPSNRFKDNTIGNRQSSTETHQKELFEAISTNILPSKASSSDSDIKNGLTDISINGYQTQIESYQIKELGNFLANGSLNQETLTSYTEDNISNKETFQNNFNHTDPLHNLVVTQKHTENEPQHSSNLNATHPANLETQELISSLEKDLISRQNEDKQSNLNDIVDNTQRIIQQMKEEINSDINSIDSRNISQSEGDTSSNESDISTEHESSYSESEEDTDHQSSNDETSATDSEEKQLSERRATIIQRNSSEENDHFEEAMDHIEDQIEDFKHTNIKILDSIARSLQEEHIISVEANNPKFTKETINHAIVKRQDKNNNVFIKVNSFEEIYTELDTTSNDKNNSEINHTNNENNFSETLILNSGDYKTEDTNHEPPVHEKCNTLPKHDIVISMFQSAFPTKLLILENIPNMYNAVLNSIEDTTITNEALQSDLSDGESTRSEASTNTEVNIESINSSLKTKEKDQIDTVRMESSETNEFNDVNQVANDSENSITSTVYQLTNTRNEEIIVEPNDKNIQKEGSPYEENSKDDFNAVERKTDNDLNETQEDLNNNNDISKSSEETVAKTINNVANKTLNSIKSNIPKLIKLVQNNKQKADKSSPKIISSKVPVRRTSQKQYHAPAPPKPHFGNIQNGHVKQLQTKLFNNKLPRTEVNIPITVNEEKPSTSTLHKKKPAPPPPAAEYKQPSPTKMSPPKEKKKNYFRESCRTEDEWTESDSEEIEIHVKRSNEEPERVPSPPPPLTLRRVSGQIIDLAKVQLPEGSPERQARMLLAQGATETWEQARLAVELAGRGASATAALLAALECADLPAALTYLHQECELCASRLPEHDMVSMLRCTHRCCQECARHYFTVQITERSIADCVCPYCKVPDLENMPEDAWLEYFAHIDILLKTLLESEVHELFQRKLRDRTLARDPNFRWCVECSSGFFVHPKQKKIRCPECRSVSCAKCRKSWSANHEGVSCEQFAAWLEDNDPERSVAAVQQHLRENGLECPRCHFKYSLSRGGCMHFTCTQCKYEFCYGCGKPFMMGAQCGLSEYCAKLGLHAHHPRNCLFYLRDKEPHQLQTLLQMNNVAYETEAPEGSPNRCPIQLQRETPTGLVDGTCGGDVPPKHAGLCKNHYLEYLSRVVRTNAVDPLPLLDAEDLETLVRRAALRLPPRPYGSLDGIYRRALTEIVKEKIPLD